MKYVYNILFWAIRNSLRGTITNFYLFNYTIYWKCIERYIERLISSLNPVSLPLAVHCYLDDILFKILPAIVLLGRNVLFVGRKSHLDREQLALDPFALDCKKFLCNHLLIIKEFECPLANIDMHEAFRLTEALEITLRTLSICIEIKSIP